MYVKPEKAHAASRGLSAARLHGDGRALSLAGAYTASIQLAEGDRLAILHAQVVAYGEGDTDAPRLLEASDAHIFGERALSRLTATFHTSRLSLTQLKLRVRMCSPGAGAGCVQELKDESGCEFRDRLDAAR
jgi:hypothetical protein